MRTFLDGRFENSAFCLLTPNGQKWLSKGGRGPEMVLGHRSAVSRMNTVSAIYGAKADVREALVPDFFSVRQALNVASADQRILVIVHGAEDETAPLKNSLRGVVNDESTVGRFHYDFETDMASVNSVKGVIGKSGIAIVRADEFGLSGTVMQHLPLDSDNNSILKALVEVNAEFARTTRKKVYSTHVQKGQKLGIYFEGNVEYGEDRDGDGEIDHRSGRGRSPGRGTRD